MKLHKLFAVTLAVASLFGGTLATSTPATAKTKKFFYYVDNGPSGYHKKYQSMNKYTLNKTFRVRYSSKVKIKHLYVFHVSPLNSRYQTWVKVTGTLYDHGTAELALGGESDDPGWGDRISSLKSANAGQIPFAFFSSNTGDGVFSPDKLNFQLLYHTKNKTAKLGQSKLTILTTYGIDVYNSKTLNLNLK